jgi:hypothetical protein
MARLQDGKRVVGKKCTGEQAGREGKKVGKRGKGNRRIGRVFA